MKMIQVGIGSFGNGWYKNIKKEHPELDLAVVDTNPEASKKITGARDRFYPSLSEAIATEKPDFILNTTPPHIHTKINHIAFDNRLPVLCEKPIAEDFAESVEIVTRTEREGIPFMIAENYRRAATMRAAKRALLDGAIGELRTLHCDFYKSFRTEKRYFVEMKDPFLSDVAVHLLDLVRYLAGSEGKEISARSFNPPGSWCRGNMALDAMIEMRNGVIVSFTGSMITKGPETNWRGNWRMEGTEGTMIVVDDKVSLAKGKEITQIGDFAGARGDNCLDDFLRSLKEKRPDETCARDYLNTQALVHFALQSSVKRQTVAVELPKIGGLGK